MSFKQWLGVQTGLTCVWSQMYVLTALVETRRNQLVLVSAWVAAAATLGAGYNLTACTAKRRVTWAYLYTFVCTCLILAVFVVASLPSLKPAPLTDHSLLGTVLSVGLVVVSVRATTCVQTVLDDGDDPSDAPPSQRHSRQPRRARRDRKRLA